MAFTIVDERYCQVANLNSRWFAFTFDNRFGRTYKKKRGAKKARKYMDEAIARRVRRGERAAAGPGDKGWRLETLGCA